MDETSKIVVSGAVGALGGFIVGILTEPIKIRFRNTNDRTRLRNLVYQDLTLINTNMVWLKHQAISSAEFSDENLRIATDRHSAAQRDRILYSELAESVDVDVLYGRLKALAAQPTANVSHRVKKMDDMIAAFESAIKDGSFSIRRLRKCKTKVLQTGLDAFKKQFLEISTP